MITPDDQTGTIAIFTSTFKHLDYCVVIDQEQMSAIAGYGCSNRLRSATGSAPYMRCSNEPKLFDDRPCKRSAFGSRVRTCLATYHSTDG
jgi:hypothetical protein